MWMGTGSSDVCPLFNGVLPFFSSLPGQDTILDLINGVNSPWEVAREWSTVS